MEKRRTYTPEEKANIVLQLLREEKTVSQIASRNRDTPHSAGPLEGGGN